MPPLRGPSLGFDGGLRGYGSGVRVVDISVPVRPGAPVYPGDPEVVVELVAARSRGDEANVSRLELGTHTGTHVDAPAHFVDGAAGAGELDLARLVGRADVVDATAYAGSSLPRDLALPDGAVRLLFKTRNADLWERDAYVDEHVRLSEELALRLLEQHVVLVGIDYLSIGSTRVHELLLSMGVVVVEGLDLREVEPGSYLLACLPLRIPGADGAPARAVLIREY